MAFPVPFEVLFQDDDLIVVAKPSGIATHPGAEHGASRRDGPTCLSLARAAAGKWVYPVHRLDRGTSGVLVMALHPEAAHQMAAAIASGAWDKRYLAIVRGHLHQPGHRGMTEKPLAAPDDATLKAATTHFHVVAQASAPWPEGGHATARYSLVSLTPTTGRTHQLRLHLRALSHPIIGDTRYGDGRHNRRFRAELGVNRLCLHAATLAFIHPRTGAPLSFAAPLPPDLTRALSLFDA